jgi:hypothetical protein
LTLLLADEVQRRDHVGLEPIREQNEQRALDVAIAKSPQPYRLIFLLLRDWPWPP